MIRATERVTVGQTVCQTVARSMQMRGPAYRLAITAHRKQSHTLRQITSLGYVRSSRVRREVREKVELLVDLYQKHDVMWKADRPNYNKKLS